MDMHLVKAVLAIVFALVVLGINLWLKTKQQKTMTQVRGLLEDAKAKAAQGDSTAHLRLGLAYHQGVGLERNSREAYFWLSLAARFGADRPQAEREVDEMFLKEAAKALTDADRADSDRRVEEWRPGPHAADTVKIAEDA
jgi:TPR repeat protein